MNPLELRIGNYINHSELHGITEVMAIGKDYIHIVFCNETFYEDIKWFTPIPLTEERLLEFGFDSDLVLRSEGLELSYTPKPSNIEVSTKFELNGVNIPIEYVHQLQNLYFALTGKDLERKQPSSGKE